MPIYNVDSDNITELLELFVSKKGAEMEGILKAAEVASSESVVRNFRVYASDGVTPVETVSIYGVRA